MTSVSMGKWLGRLSKTISKLHLKKHDEIHWFGFCDQVIRLGLKLKVVHISFTLIYSNIIMIPFNVNFVCDFFLLSLELKLEYIAEYGLNSVRYLMGPFCSWAQGLTSHQFFVYLLVPSGSLGLRVSFCFAL